MPDNKEIRMKLSKLDRVKLNTLALDLGIKGYDKQEQQELVDNIVESKEEKDILQQLRHLDAPHLKSNEDIYLKLSALDPIVLNVVAHKLGIEDYSHQERHELIGNILKNRGEKVILRELENNWNDIFLKLSESDRIVINVVAYDLGIKDCSQQKKRELVGSILKNRERKAILKELDNNWNDLFLKLHESDDDELNAVAKKLGIKVDRGQERPEVIENILKYRNKKAIRKALHSWWRRMFFIGYVAAFVGFVGSWASIIALINPNILDDLKKLMSEQTVTTTTVTTISPVSTVPPIHKKPVNHDLLLRNEAEKFFKAIQNAPPATYDENNLPDFAKTPGIEYAGELKVNNDSIITGEMKFSHKKSANTFTLNNDGIISPKKRDEWIDPVTEMKFIWISGGCYDTGCMNGFWMGKSEVTQGQWKKIMGNNPSFIGGDDDPVQNVSWDNATAFIEKLNGLNKKGGRSKKYRLPKETEWEYACKNGSGIDNMKGGVQEWCEDVFHSHRQNREPVQYSSHTVSRVVRGNPKKSSGCTYREGSLSSEKSRHIGFRLVSNQTE